MVFNYKITMFKTKSMWTVLHSWLGMDQALRDKVKLTKINGQPYEI